MKKIIIYLLVFFPFALLGQLTEQNTGTPNPRLAGAKDSHVSNMSLRTSDSTLLITGVGKAHNANIDLRPVLHQIPTASPQNLIQDADADTKVQVEESTDEDIIRFDVAGSERMIISNTGAVGIGTNAPSNQFHILNNSITAKIAMIDQSGTGDASSSFRITGVTEYIMGIDNDDSDKFKISKSGLLGSNDQFVISGSNIGLGESSPTEKLHVNGNIRFPGALMPNNLPGTAGQVLTSAGSGVAPTWGSIATIQDADADTKIQVEESTDEDIIRMDIAGVEKFNLSANGLDVTAGRVRSYGQGALNTAGSAQMVLLNTSGANRTGRMFVDDTGLFSFYTSSATSPEISMFGGVTINDGGARYDFTVETENVPDAIYVDAENDRVNFNTGVTHNFVTVAPAGAPGTYAVLATDYGIGGNTQFNDVTITLPASPTTGRMLYISKESTANTLSIDGNGNTINGSSPLVLTALHESVTLFFNGSQWRRF